MVMMERQVLMAAMVFGLVIVVGVMQRDERSKIKFFGRGLMLQIMREKERKLHKVRTRQEPLYPEDRQ